LAEDREKLERFQAKMHSMGFLPRYSSGVGYRSTRVDDCLIKAVVKCETHVLCNIFPTHDFSLPVKDDHSFISYILYKAVTKKQLHLTFSFPTELKIMF